MPGKAPLIKAHENSLSKESTTYAPKLPLNSQPSNNANEVVIINKEPKKPANKPKTVVINENSKEKIKRSLLKTISWRVIGTLDTILISWLITGAMTLALSIGTIELISKMVLYFFHERLWNQIKWG